MWSVIFADRRMEATEIITVFVLSFERQVQFCYVFKTNLNSENVGVFIVHPSIICNTFVSNGS